MVCIKLNVILKLKKCKKSKLILEFDKAYKVYIWTIWLQDPHSTFKIVKPKY